MKKIKVKFIIEKYINTIDHLCYEAELELEDDAEINDSSIDIESKLVDEVYNSDYNYDFEENSKLKLQSIKNISSDCGSCILNFKIL